MSRFPFSRQIAFRSPQTHFPQLIPAGVGPVSCLPWSRLASFVSAWSSLPVPTILGTFRWGSTLPPSRPPPPLFLSRFPLEFLAFFSHRSAFLERSVFNTLLLFQFFLWPLRLFIQHCVSFLVWHPSPLLSWFIEGSVLVLKDPLYQVLCDGSLLVPFLGCFPASIPSIPLCAT
jgi:hypothetical protein